MHARHATSQAPPQRPAPVTIVRCNKRAVKRNALEKDRSVDATTRALATFATDLRYGALPANTLHEAKRHLVDSIACLLGGYRAEPASIARRLAAAASGTPARAR
jgi:hypothetical protein